MNEYYRGEKLIGDDYSLEQLKEWYEDEEEAYFDLMLKGNGREVLGDFPYHELHYKYGYRYIGKGSFNEVLGVGSSFGNEFLPIIDQITNLSIIESSESSRSNMIGSITPNYKFPNINGKIDYTDDRFNLITCFSVLHHIANVTFVMKELYRVLKPGGYLLIMEPIHSMGDWTKPRKGLTKRERGIPPKLFKKIIDECGFGIINEKFCFTATPFIYRKLEPFLKRPLFAGKFYLAFDAFISKLFEWNMHYHATKKRQRIAPQVVFYVLRK